MPFGASLEDETTVSALDFGVSTLELDFTEAELVGFAVSELAGVATSALDAGTAALEVGVTSALEAGVATSALDAGFATSVLDAGFRASALEVGSGFVPGPHASGKLDATQGLLQGSFGLTEAELNAGLAASELDAIPGRPPP
jgi:hypothetical protein